MEVKLRRLAEAYGTNIDGLAKMLGYTRQALYHMVTPRRKKVCTERINEAVELLKKRSNDMYIKDIARANIDKREREEFLRKFCKQVGIVDVTEVEK